MGIIAQKNNKSKLFFVKSGRFLVNFLFYMYNTSGVCMDSELELLIRRVEELERKVELYYQMLKINNELDFIMNGTYLSPYDIESIMEGTY